MANACVRLRSRTIQLSDSIQTSTYICQTCNGSRYHQLPAVMCSRTCGNDPASSRAQGPPKTSKLPLHIRVSQNLHPSQNKVGRANKNMSVSQKCMPLEMKKVSGGIYVVCPPKRNPPKRFPPPKLFAPRLFARLRSRAPVPPGVWRLLWQSGG